MRVAALVLGGAECVWEEERQAWALLSEYVWDRVLVVAVNDAGCWYAGQLDAWATLHPQKLVLSDPQDPAGLSWIKRRERNGYPGGYHTYARRRSDLVHHRVEHWGGGSSGLYAVRVAAYLEATHTLLCGVPLSRSPIFEESVSYHDVDSHMDGYRKGWKRKLSRPESAAGRYLLHHVRGSCGWTRELLGGVTPEWLASDPGLR